MISVQRLPMRLKLLLAILITTLIVGVAVSLLVYRAIQHHIELTGFMTARALGTQIATVRSFYTSEVVHRARQAGMRVDHDFRDRENTLPLPATLVNVLGDQIRQDQPGANIRLYSRYPFPHRRATEQYDSFELDAIDQLERNSDKPFWRLENYRGRPSMRFAAADIMSATCVECHNSHPDSPKKDWKVGDVRGVVEVIVPVDDAKAQLRASLLQLGLWVAVGFACILGVTTFTIHNTARSLDSKVTSFGTGLTQIAAAVLDQDQVARQQTEAAHRAASSMEQLESIARSNAQKAQAVAENVREVRQLAQDGTSAVQSSLGSVDQLQQNVASISDQVLQLGGQIDQIAEVTRLVAGFARSTNLLALNAAVEAVRAGASGEGFGVVATEIRKLADQSQGSLDRIRRLVQRIQEAKEATLRVSDEGTRQLTQVAGAAHKAGHIFQTLADSTAISFEHARQIAANAQEQASNTRQVLDAIASVHRGVADTAQRIAETQSTLVALNQAALEVRRTI